jgi:putative acetyltransferase
MEIRPARFPEEGEVVHELFREYASGVGVDLCFQGFEQELAGLPGKYAPPSGGLWLAVDVAPAGCIALRSVDSERCEIKRLFVSPAFRGVGLGRMLAEHVLAAARESEYRQILLDTLPSMTAAIAMYRSLGFADVQPYCHNPIPGALYLGLDL